MTRTDARACRPIRPDPIPAFQPLLERLDLTDAELAVGGSGAREVAAG